MRSGMGGPAPVPSMTVTPGWTRPFRVRPPGRVHPRDEGRKHPVVAAHDDQPVALGQLDALLEAAAHAEVALVAQ